MAFKYLLDTNILSSLIKQPAGPAARKIASLDDEKKCCTSMIVACELQYGAHKKGSAALSRKVAQLLQAIAVLPLDDAVVAQHYAEIRVELEQKGWPIGEKNLFGKITTCSLVPLHQLQQTAYSVCGLLRDPPVSITSFRLFPVLIGSQRNI